MANHWAASKPANRLLTTHRSIAPVAASPVCERTERSDDASENGADSPDADHPRTPDVRVIAGCLDMVRAREGERPTSEHRLSASITG